MIPSLYDFDPECVTTLMKVAAEKKKKEPSPAARKGRIIAKGLLSYGVGTGLGFGASALADHLYERAKGKPLPKSRMLQAVPFLMGAGGMAYGIHKALEQEELNDVGKD